MAKKVSLSQIVETLKAENEKLTTELTQKKSELEYAQRWHSAGQAEIDRCHALLNISSYAPPVEGREFEKSDLSIRIMGLLLAFERRINEISSKNKGE